MVPDLRPYALDLAAFDGGSAAKVAPAEPPVLPEVLRGVELAAAFVRVDRDRRKT